MVKHIVAWKVKEGIADKQAVKQNIKEKLEALVGVIPEIIKLQVVTDLASTSTHDLLLLSGFESFEALARYAKSPEHVKVAEEDIVPFVCERFCADYED